MMATFKLVKKPRSPNILHHEIRQEVVRALKPVAKAHVESRERVVANWDNKPKFKAETKVTPDKIEILVAVRRGARLKDSKSGATVNDLWKWIDLTGTRAHTITPRQTGGVLQFQAGQYQSKTGANPARYGGPGTVQNPQQVFTKRVQHPGFPARHFTEVINRDLRKDFDNAVRNGYRRGFKKVGR